MAHETPPWRRYVEAYREFQDGEDIPVHDGWKVDDVRDAPTEPWARTGGEGALVNLAGMEDLCDVHVHRIPPGESLAEQQHLHEGIVFVADGAGFTTVGREGTRQTFEWNQGALFHLPRNTPYVHANASETEEALLLVTTPLPMLYSLHRHDEYLWDTGLPDERLLHDDEEYFATASSLESQEHEELNVIYYEARFVSDATSFTDLREWPDRGAGGRSVFFQFPGSSMFSHMSEFPPGRYKKAHRHLSCANILILSGEGYSLIWTEDGERVRVDWEPYTLLTPPTMYFHQHFNTGEEPARYLVFHGAIKGTGINENVVLDPFEPANQIEYHQEDPAVREEFEASLAAKGLETDMAPELYEG